MLTMLYIADEANYYSNYFPQKWREFCTALGIHYQQVSLP